MTVTVLYVTSRWGKSTETFVRREVAAVRGAGATVRVLSLKRPILAADDPDVEHRSGIGLVLGGVVAAVRRPVRSTRAFVRIISLSRRETVLAHLAGFVHGLAAARSAPDVDVVHAHFAWVSATAADVVSTWRDVPFGIMPHAFDIYDHRVIDRYLADKLRRARLLFVESEQIAADVRRSYGAIATPLRIGVPREMTENLPDRSGSGARIVTVGSLVTKKGHDNLIASVAGLAASLTIVGEGPEEQHLRSLICSLGADDRVQFKGYLRPEQVIEELDAHDVFVLASRIDPSGDRDGVPNVLIEAMARGLPVIATDVGGVADLIEGVGIVVPPNDEPALTEALILWLDDVDARAAAGAAGHRRITDHYVAEVNGAWLADQFEEVSEGCDRRV